MPNGVRQNVVAPNYHLQQLKMNKKKLAAFFVESFRRRRCLGGDDAESVRACVCVCECEHMCVCVCV